MVKYMESNDILEESYRMEQDSQESVHHQSESCIQEKVTSTPPTVNDEDEFFDAQSSSQNLNTINNKNDELLIKDSVEHFLIPNSQDTPVVNNFKDEKQQGHMFNKSDLTQFIVMQLELIGHQQLQIQQKDKKIISLKAEKEQLEAKLSRMERRISIQKRHSLELNAAQDESITITRSKIGSPALKSPLVSNVSQKKKSTESPTIDKFNMAPITITSCNDKGFSFENFLRTNVTYSDPPFQKQLCKKFVDETVDVVKICEKKVPVPPWRILDSCKKDNIESVDVVEDISDAAYERRHLKPELEEKRRKRWDLQQARQQRLHEQLVQRYNEREQKTKLQNTSLNEMDTSNLSKSNTIDQLAKTSNDLHAVDVTEIVPVCAFGYPLPALAPRELDIPWFSIAKREVQLRTAKQKKLQRKKRK